MGAPVLCLAHYWKSGDDHARPQNETQRLPISASRGCSSVRSRRRSSFASTQTKELGNPRILQILGGSNCQTFAPGRGVTPSSTGNKWLLLEYQRRSADSPPFEVDYHFDAVGDLYQGDAFVHAIVLAVKGHSSFNLP